jgi:hypothetical protein
MAHNFFAMRDIAFPDLVKYKIGQPLVISYIHPLLGLFEVLIPTQGLSRISSYGVFLRLLSRVASYCVSTPTGLGPSTALPQVAPVAIISLRELLRFTFNPFGVGTLTRYQQNPL